MAFQRKTIERKRIQEINGEGWPPTVWVGQELIIVSAELRDPLKAFAQSNHIPLQRRHDTWGDLLEPFLDTQFNDKEQEQTLIRLAANGIPRHETAQIRQQVGAMMMKYNFDTMLWEWVHLGLLDLLMAHQMFGKGHFDEFYWFAMEIALRSYR